MHSDGGLLHVRLGYDQFLLSGPGFDLFVIGFSTGQVGLGGSNVFSAGFLHCLLQLGLVQGQGGLVLGHLEFQASRFQPGQRITSLHHLPLFHKKLFYLASQLKGQSDLSLGGDAACGADRGRDNVPLHDKLFQIGIVNRLLLDRLAAKGLIAEPGEADDDAQDNNNGNSPFH